MRTTAVSSNEIHADASRRAAAIGWRLPLLAAALILGFTGRIAYSYNAPFWFDETFTGVIATQPTPAALLKWCLSELTGPAFYMPMWAWEKVAGSSDFALRLPSLAISLATPLAILRFGNRDADLRLWWTVFVLLWVPIFAEAGEARSYPEIFMLGVVQAMLFVRLLERPSTARASAWVIVSSLVILCHYWSVVPCIVQGVAFLAVHRLRAMRTWPALAFLLPMLAWCWFHLPFVLSFTIGGAHGISGLPLSAALTIPQMLLGVSFSATVILAVVAGSMGIAWARSGWRTDGRPAPETVLALCGLASIVVILALGFVRPGFSPRYATAAMPSFLFGLALWARWATARAARAVVIVAVMLLSTAAGLVGSILHGPDKDARHKFELERPSAWLAQRSPKHLVMFWDGPIAAVSSAARLAEVGGFFLRRDGVKVDVSVARASPSDDPNRRVLAAARGRPDSAILWFANDELPASRAPRIERYDAGFECKDFGGGEVTMTACRRRN